MKQSELFSLPKDHPSHHSTVSSFKAKHNIWTYRSRGLTREEHPWCALLVMKAREICARMQADEMELISKSAALLEEAGVLVTGEGELTTIRELCRQNKIECNL